ncbi:hypothetical protein [Lachnotalea glycerini]|uniref:Uncharacterized protein n=1 Tax=Lachnotalea glycerini TaxID=1763509 RepID=A0A371JBL8_9FIRM|nr:hypothetical protein [Lachnotalea glycerini]RDY30145.1 hypothetical protein CG710_016315 [Lachnotalea glycerini]
MEVGDDDLLADITRIAHNLNTNILAEKDYILAGGLFEIETFNRFGSFNAACVLCGLKLLKYNKRK